MNQLQTYQQKNKLLLLVTLLFCIIAYRFSFNKTIQLYYQNQQATQAIQQANNAPSEIQHLQEQLNQIKGTSPKKNYSQEYLLEEVSRFCRQHDLLIKNFPEAQIFEERNYTIIISQIEVEGRYQAIVQLAYLLEHQHQLGSITSLEMRSHHNQQTKIHYLTGKLILNTIRRNT